jgi:hypothetical protein
MNSMLLKAKKFLASFILDDVFNDETEEAPGCGDFILSLPFLLPVLIYNYLRKEFLPNKKANLYAK